MIKYLSANYTIDSRDKLQTYVYRSGSYTVMLPNAKGTEVEIVISNLGTGLITVKAQPLDKIGVETSLILTQGDTMCIIDADNQLWVII